MRILIDTYGGALGKAVVVHTGYVLVSVAIGFLLGLDWASSSPGCPGGCPIW